MTWYKEDNALDYSKPIVAKDKDGEELYILLPQIENDSYRLVGYNWFNPKTGEYNSCACFKSAKKAISSYQDYVIYNADIEITRRL